MRALVLSLGFSVLALFPGQGNAGDRVTQSTASQNTVSNSAKQTPNTPNGETYRGHYLDLAAVVGRRTSPSWRRCCGIKSISSRTFPD